MKKVSCFASASFSNNRFPSLGELKVEKGLFLRKTQSMSFHQVDDIGDRMDGRIGLDTSLHTSFLYAGKVLFVFVNTGSVQTCIQWCNPAREVILPKIVP